MQDALERYVKHLIAERNASPHTVSNYRREIAQFMVFAQGQGVMAWGDVTPALLRQWLALLHSQGYVKASVVRRISELRAFYTYLRRHDLVTTNPVQAISAPKLPQRLPRPLSREEIDMLLAAPDTATPQGQRDRAMLELLYAGGLRVSELLALDLSQVDLAQGQVRVLGKGAKERVALIGRPAVEALRNYLADGRRPLAGAAGGVGGATAAQIAGGISESFRPALVHQHVYPDVGRLRRGGRDRAQGDAAHAPPQLRHASARWRRRSALGAGVAGPRAGQHDTDLYPGQPESAP